MKFDLLKFLEKYGIIKIIGSLLFGFAIIVILPQSFIIYCGQKFTSNSDLQTLICFASMSIFSLFLFIIFSKFIPFIYRKIKTRKQLIDSINKIKDNLNKIKNNNECLKLLKKFYNMDLNEFITNAELPISSYSEATKTLELLNFITYAGPITIYDRDDKPHNLDWLTCCTLNSMLKNKELIINKNSLTFDKSKKQKGENGKGGN